MSKGIIVKKEEKPTLQVTNTSWSVEKLILCINDNSITKPKFQREKSWIIQPDGNNRKANYREFIDFLFKNRNSVSPISFGEIIEDRGKKYVNVDGNNRLNAIYAFINTPFLIYPEYVKDITEIINILPINDDKKKKIRHFFETMSYNTLSRFRRFSSLYKGDETFDIFENLKKKNIDKFEQKLEQIQKELLIFEQDCFDKVVMININLFTNADYSMLSTIFENINKHPNSLSDSEILASVLFNTTITVKDKHLKLHIINYVKDFYNDKDKDEILSGHTINKDNIDDYKLNAFDVLVGLQKHYHTTYLKIIGDFNSKGISLFFKLYKYCYLKLDKNSFTDDNVNEFISYITECCDILLDCYQYIFPDVFLEKSQKVFNTNTLLHKIALKTNQLFIIFTYLINNLKKKVDIEKIKDEIQLVIVYHSCVREVKDKETKELLFNYDIMHFKGAGAIITNLAKELETTLISKKITKKKFEKVMQILINESNNPITYKTKTARAKRRNLKLIDKLLSSFYYRTYMSKKFYNNKFSNEHIVPWSSRCIDENEEYDLDRVGNMVPMISGLNSGRKNNHINYYSKNKPKFVKLLDVIPSNKDYDAIMNHDKKRIFIKNIKKYNEMCEKNEKKYLDNFLKEIFAPYRLD